METELVGFLARILYSIYINTTEIKAGNLHVTQKPVENVYV